MEPSNQPEPLLVSIKRGREILGDIGNTKFYELINEGKIKTVKIGRRTLPTYSSLKELANAQ